MGEYDYLMLERSRNCGTSREVTSDDITAMIQTKPLVAKRNWKMGIGLVPFFLKVSWILDLAKLVH